MRRIRIIGLCLVAGAGVWAGSALTIGLGVANAGGTYCCLTEGGRSASDTFKRVGGPTTGAHVGQAISLGSGDPLKGLNVSKSDPRWATATGPTTLQGEVILEGVTASYELGGESSEEIQCNSAGAAPGVVKLQPITEEIAWINKASGEVGREERPTKGNLLAKFTCGHHTVEIRGAVIGALTPVNTVVGGPGGHFTVADTENKETEKQAITGFEGGPKAVLEFQFDRGGFSEVVLTSSLEMVPSRAVEVSTKSGTPEFVLTTLAGPEFTGYCKTVQKVPQCGLFPIPFKSKEGATSFTSVGLGTVDCKASMDIGEITGPKTDKEELSFKGCTLGGQKCTQNGVAIIKTQPLSSVIGYADAGTKEVGDDLYNPAGRLLVELECGEELMQVEVSVIGLIMPIKTLTKNYSVAFSAAAGRPGEQNSLKLEGGPPDSPICDFNNAISSECAFVSTDAVTMKYATELAA